MFNGLITNPSGGGGGVPIIINVGDDVKAILEGASTGDWFYIMPGDHTVQNLTITANDLLVEGSKGATLTFSNGSGGIAITVTSDNVRLRGFTIFADAEQGIRIEHTANNFRGINLTFIGDTTSGHSSYAIYFDGGGSQHEFTGCIITGTWYLSLLSMSTSIEPDATRQFTDCYFDGGKITSMTSNGMGRGLRFEGCLFNDVRIDFTYLHTANASFHHCYFYQHTITNSIIVGATCSLTDNFFLQDTGITDSTPAIQLLDNAQATGNNIEAYGYGIKAHGNNLINGNKIRQRNTSHAVYAISGSAPVITGNEILMEGTGGNGIHGDTVDSIAITGNKVYRSGSTTGAGIFVTGTNITVSGNLVDASGQTPVSYNGIGIDTNAPGSVISDNVVKSASDRGFESGIYVHNENCSVTGNSVYYWGAYGINSLSGYTTITGNMLYGAGTYGVYDDGKGNDQVIANNIIREYGSGAWTGIYLPNTGGCVIAGNRIDAAGQTAMNINASGSDLLVKDNVYNGSVTLPTDGVNNCAVKDNLQRTP